MTISKNNKMMSHIGYKMKIIVQDSRTFIGYFKAFDKHMNLILADCEELRRVKPKPGKKIGDEMEEKRILGLVLLRGDKIISISVEGPPQKDDTANQAPKAGALGGVGLAKGAGRGMPPMPPMAPPMGGAGLQGPIHGIGGGMQGAFPPMPPMPGAPY